MIIFSSYAPFRAKTSSDRTTSRGKISNKFCEKNKKNVHKRTQVHKFIRQKRDAIKHIKSNRIIEMSHYPVKY